MSKLCIIALIVTALHHECFSSTTKFPVSLQSQRTQLMDGQERLKPHFKRFDYKDIRANGLRSLSKVIDKFFSVVVSTQPDVCNQKHAKRLSDIATLLIKAVQVAELLTSDQGAKMYELILSVTAERVKSLVQIGPFYLEPSSLVAIKIYNRLICFSSHVPLHAELFDDEHLTSTAANHAVHATNKDISRVWNFWESPLIQDYYSSLFPVQTLRTVRVPTSDKSLRQFVPCQLIRNSPSGDSDVLFDVHGGGFIANSPAGSNAFLLPWSKELSSVAILSPDYSLSPKVKFPVALRELFEVYRFLVAINNQEYRLQLLGFRPLKVVLLGNSAGGNLALALCRLLVETKSPLPKSVVLVHPFVVPSMSWALPSRSLMITDSILPISTFFVMADAYAPCSRSSDLPSGPWYRKPGRDGQLRDIEEVSKNESLFNSFATPLTGLQNVPLSIIVGEFDPLLDDAVALAKTWPRDVDLVVVEGLTHGFLYNAGMSLVASKASDKCVDIIRTHFAR